MIISQITLFEYKQSKGGFHPKIHFDIICFEALSTKIIFELFKQMI